MPNKQGQSELFKNLPQTTKRRMSQALLRAAENSPYPSMVVNGQPGYMYSRHRTTISTGIAILANTSVIPTPIYSQKTLNWSDVYLNGIGISVLDSQRGYTLLSNPESAENSGASITNKNQINEYNNPNILNSDDYSFIQNENISMENSFQNLNDPFYELDSGINEYHQLQQQKYVKKTMKADTIIFGAHMSLINIHPHKVPQKKLKYFNTRAAAIAFKRSKF